MEPHNPKLIKTAGALLDLPPKTIITALLVYHRFQRLKPTNLDDIKDERLVSAVLFLACKLEETSIKTNDLLNCVRLTLNPQAPVLVSDSYYAEKDQLIITEQVVCRCIKFDFSGLDPPHKYLYCFCKTLVVPVNVVRLATCALNDSLSLPDDQRALDGATAAAAALYVAAEVLKERLSLCRVSSERDGRGNEKHRHTHYSTEHKEKERVDEESAVGTWWEGLGIDKEELKKAVECLTHLLVQSPQ